MEEGRNFVRNFFLPFLVILLVGDSSFSMKAKLCSLSSKFSFRTMFENSGYGLCFPTVVARFFSTSTFIFDGINIFSSEFSATFDSNWLFYLYLSKVGNLGVETKSEIFGNLTPPKQCSAPKFNELFDLSILVY